jgi:hypothetical protein
MSSVYEPPYTSESRNLGETAESLKERGSRAFQNASRAAADSFRRVSDSAGELFDTPEKRNVTIGALATTLGVGFLIGWIVGRATAD